MNAFVNYFIEVNIGLCVTALLYVTLFRGETNFAMVRGILLFALWCSITFPLLRFNSEELSALSEVVPTVWLDEFTVGGITDGLERSTAWVSPSELFFMLYGIGVAAFLTLFIVQLLRIGNIIKRSSAIKIDGLFIAEGGASLPSFSFFNFILIGHADALTEMEKEQIIQHEAVHARRYHSLDMILLNIIAVFFWCNPAVYVVKKAFVHLHEFEADSRAVKNRSLNDYCSLLARVALLSADVKIANHFSNSLTLKRIQMMRKIKLRIKPWKQLAVGVTIPLLFFIVACNDQAMNEIAEVARETHMAIDVPPHVQERLDHLVKTNPEKKYIMIELSGTGKEALDELQQKYGLPTSVEIFKGSESVKGSSESGVILEKEDGGTDGVRSFAILEYNSMTRDISELSMVDDIFTMVEETANFPEGMPALYQLLAEKIQYPLEARREGVEGKVFVEFVVEKDGSLTNLSIKRGVHPSIDAEALRVMEMSPKWNPGKQKGVNIRQRLILPISFKLMDQNNQLEKTGSLLDILNPIPPIKPKQKDGHC